MRTNKLLTAIILLAGLTMITGNTFAQRGQRAMVDKPERGSRMMEQCVMDLTPDQQDQMKTLRTNHLKEVTPLKNELGEKRARLHTLKSTHPNDLNAINKTIDEMSAIRANIQKKGAAHRAEGANLLNEEQRAMFYARKTGRMGQKGKQSMGRGGRAF